MYSIQNHYILPLRIYIAESACMSFLGYIYPSDSKKEIVSTSDPKKEIVYTSDPKKK